MNEMQQLDQFAAKPRNRFATMLTLAGILFVVDRLTKWWIIKHFVLGESRPYGRYFSLTYVQNTGTAFGLMQNSNKALLVLGLVILGSLLYAARGLYERGGMISLVGISHVLGGALGNLLDRYRHGYVVDFLDFHFWPVFNVADSAITVGTIVIMFGLFLQDRKEAKSV